VPLPDGSVIFTENQADRIAHIALDGTTSTYLDNTGGSNSLAFNNKGELLAALTAKPGIGIIYPADKVKTLVDSYEGKPLNRPNDLVADKKGGVYFTDPGANPQPGQAAPIPAVYYLTPAGKLLLLGNDIERPNGVQLSPDERTLYVANTRGEYVLAYDIATDGSVSNKRNFAKLAGFKQNDAGVWSSGADGLAVDAAGNLYAATSAGVQIFNSKGSALGVIALPKSPQNLAFAGKDKKTLYVVGRGSAYRIATLTSGFKGRVK
jgi:gluconolactonase